MENLNKRFREGNQEAFHEIFNLYKKKVYDIALIYTNNRSLADDITQEAFIRMFSKHHLYKEEYSFETWMYRIVVNTANNLLRKQKWLRLFKDDKEESYHIGRSNSQIELGEQSVDILYFVEKLPHKLKAVLVLKYYQDLTQEQIAAILKIPIGTVKSRISLGLKKLRVLIENDTNSEENDGYEKYRKRIT
ncbi:RNA polymerase sigma-70 factor (ECF subfamily) [Metabacillus crassostreae]|uniref:RNA polymerase sigma factor n=1 Tax=Metabacillus crassostreae TaxID=929098 RepID=UPI00195EA898|nr:RNA polymerase sigma factor [Metabacillus crassostreae]MBM7604863.1 RNA polymerase sigma-70 factor (ECF subfamily) [Metabacillus crassostreae]